MTVRELITKLLDMPMDFKISVHVSNDSGDMVYVDHVALEIHKILEEVTLVNED